MQFTIDSVADSVCLFVLSFFPQDVLGEILDLVESVSEDFPTYSHSMTIPNISSKATGPIVTKFYVEPPGAKWIFFLTAQVT